MKGVFITFEGPDGSGKSTQAKLLMEYLKSFGFNSILTREPGGVDICERIRSILKDSSLNSIMSHQTEALLFQAARAQLVHQLIKPMLIQGGIVICDRYMDSSIAYQGVARGHGVKNIKQLNAFSTDGVTPDLTLLLDVTPEVGLTRADKRSACSDRFETEAIEFHDKVRNAFLYIAKEDPARVKVFDASVGVEELHQKIRELVHQHIKIHNQLQS